MLFADVRGFTSFSGAGSGFPVPTASRHGIHCGIAVVGKIGTAERLEYTAIGSMVNVAARLCESAGKGEVVISEEVRDRLGDRIEVEMRAPILVKGIDRELVTYRVKAVR